MNKFLLNQEQKNLWIFINLYKKYQNKQLNANELFNFYNNLKLLNSENKQLNELINDDHFLEQFIFNWENRFILYNHKN